MRYGATLVPITNVGGSRVRRRLGPWVSVGPTGEVLPDFQLRIAVYASEPTEGKLVKLAEAVTVLVPARRIEAGLADPTRPPAVLGDGN